VKLLALLVLAQAAPPPPATPSPSPSELVKKLDQTAGLKEKDKPFEIAVSLGRLYFGQRRYAEARTFFSQAVAGAEDARKLYLAQLKAAGSKPVPGAADVGCAPGGDATLVSLHDKAKALAGKNAPGAVACLRAALAPLMEVEVLLGHSNFLLKDVAGALAVYTKALETFPSNVDARYARAALTLDAFGDDVKALERARADFEKVLADSPTSPRAPTAKRLLERTNAAIAAGGLSKLGVSPEQVSALQPAPPAAPPQPPAQGGTPPVLTKEMMDAFQNTPRTAEMDENFKKLIDEAEEHLARQRFQDALNSYKGVMPYQPDNARVRAGLAWTMLKLNRQPMADNVWRVATTTPEAIDQLGDTLKAKGDAAGAKEVWQRLKESVPSYGAKLEGKL
jgi:tetratricopeptide (TPR) repeat protein